jgi:hypothetical protein
MTRQRGQGLSDQLVSTTVPHVAPGTSARDEDRANRRNGLSTLGLVHCQRSRRDKVVMLTRCRAQRHRAGRRHITAVELEFREKVVVVGESQIPLLQLKRKPIDQLPLRLVGELQSGNVELGTLERLVDGIAHTGGVHEDLCLVIQLGLPLHLLLLDRPPLTSKWANDKKLNPPKILGTFHLS